MIYFENPERNCSAEEVRVNQGQGRLVDSHLFRCSVTTVLPAYPVSARKAKELQARMDATGCRERDLDETFLRGGGVVLCHRPTDVRARCCRERSQSLNRFFARRSLVEELEARKQQKTRHEVTSERLRLEKKRRPKMRLIDHFEKFRLRPLEARDQPPK